MELSYTEPMKNTIYGGAVYMELHELGVCKIFGEIQKFF